MKIFEFAFNPKKRRDRFFSVHSYKPSLKEKAKGSLYIIGELDNALEFNERFLKRLSETVQTEYYNSTQKTALRSLKVALKKVNEFLAQQKKKGNVDWLGNLHVAVLLFITVSEKKTMFHLTKTGSIKISLMRQGIITDIGKNLEKTSAKPGTVFENVASGSLIPNDSVTTITKEIFDIFLKEKALKEIGVLKEIKEFTDFFLKRERMLKKISGVLVSFVIEKEEAKHSRIDKSLLPRLPSLPLGLKRQLFLPSPSLMLKKVIKLTIKKPKVGFSQIHLPATLKKQAILVLLFLLLLLLGVLVFT